MFGFGKSEQLEKREQVLKERERILQLREQELNALEQQLIERETNVDQLESESAEKIQHVHFRENEALKAELKAAAQLNIAEEARFQLKVERENFLLWKKKETQELTKNVGAQIQQQLKKGYQDGFFQGRLEGLKSGKKSYQTLERERDVAKKRSRNSFFANKRRNEKAQKETQAE